MQLALSGDVAVTNFLLSAFSSKRACKSILMPGIQWHAQILTKVSVWM